MDPNGQQMASQRYRLIMCLGLNIPFSCKQMGFLMPHLAP